MTALPVWVGGSHHPAPWQPVALQRGTVPAEGPWTPARVSEGVQTLGPPEFPAQQEQPGCPVRPDVAKRSSQLY